MQIKEINCPRLILKTIAPEDYRHLFTLWHDEALIQYTYHQYMATEEDARQKVLKVIDRYSKIQNNAGPFLIFNKDHFVGYCGMDLQSETLREYELFYIILPEHHGKGYASEVSRALTDLAFKALGAERVSAEAVDVNIASQRVLENTGMKKEGQLRRKFYKGKDFHDLLVYGILKPEWENNLKR